MPAAPPRSWYDGLDGAALCHTTCLGCARAWRTAPRVCAFGAVRRATPRGWCCSLWTTRTATGRSWGVRVGLGSGVFGWLVWGTGLGGFGSGPARGCCVLCVLCVCMHACAFGGVFACLKKNKSTTKSRTVRRLSPRRSCGPAAAHAEVETVEGGAVRGGGGRGCGGEGRLAIPRVLFKRCLSERRHVPGPVQEFRILQAVQKSSLCKNILI